MPADADRISKEFLNCSFYRKGDCKYANRCKFKHENCPKYENCKEKGCELGHPKLPCEFYKFGKCKRGNVCKFKHEDCKNESCQSPECPMGHSNRNKRVNEEMNPITVHSKSEKRVKTAPPATVVTLSSKNCNEDL